MDERWITHRVRTDAQASGDMDALLLREWTLTNGTGAYAMGTAAGCNTRRYHGLLVAATRPPVGRVVALSQMWEQLVLSPAGLPGVAEQTLDFSTLLFRNLHDGGRTFAPRGVALLTRFDRGLSVRWSYRWGAIGFERELVLHWKQQAATLRYGVSGLDEARMQARLRLHPMVTLRDFHGLRGRSPDPCFELDDHLREYFTVADPANPLAAVTFLSSHGDFAPHPHWWENTCYPADAERGQADAEDLFVPCRLDTPVTDETVVEVTAALGREPVEPVGDTFDRAEHLRRVVETVSGFDARVPSPQPEAQRSKLETLCFAIASDDFVVDRTIAGERLSTVIAGYPWFGDWGRDTFIALPGLLLCTGRFEEAKRTLRAFADAIQQGLVPNRFDDYDDQAAHYNTVDASLWFVHAAMRYVHTTGDADGWREWIAAACLRVIDAYIIGTGYGIVMDTDGLITAGDETTQLTWMDAKIGDVAFTPRHGKAVEVNALWHHALRGLVELLGNRGISENLGDRFADAAASCDKLAERVAKGFTKRFWNERSGCLFDCWTPGADGAWYGDPAIRPNQLFAVSLPFSPLPPAKQKRVLAVVQERLLTPVGLRTLAPGHPEYRGRYTGNQWERDAAYHQGTVWPWLLGPYAEAVLRVGRFSRKARDEARAAIAPLLEMLTTASAPASLGQLHEVYEADAVLPPTSPSRGHRPVGAVAQAWSVAEVLRVHQLLSGGGPEPVTATTGRPRAGGGGP